MIYKLLDCSTAHIERSDTEILNRADSFPLYARYDEGYFLYVETPYTGEEAKMNEYYFKNLKDKGFSWAFLNLFGYARDNGCVRIQLDRDGDILDGLPVFDW